MNAERKNEFILGIGDYNDLEVLSQCLNPVLREIGVARFLCQ